MEVGDVPLGVGEDRVVGRVGVQLHDPAERRVVSRLGACIGLNQGVDRALHQSNGHPPVALAADDGSVRGVVDGEAPPRQAAVGLEGDGERAGADRRLAIAVAVVGPAAALHHRFQKLVDVVHPARGVHPAAGRVEPLIHEELPPRHRAVRIEALVARHLQLGAKVERCVRIDPQERMVVSRELRRDGDAVGPTPLGG